ncbi:MAG TPA: helix-turn-helix domain-containing protein [Streptosporangiaceae bacterium]|nr:helix-turn-helix domain-containing protein [Streptosporangiaceae bacterium]
MNEHGPDVGDTGHGPETVRTVSDIETLKAIADPLRLAILTALMRSPGGGLPVMTVKELAAQLGEPQTKLYRHVRHLESVGLIKAVASRVVSGILEQRYQACQGDLMLGPGLTNTQKSSAEGEAAVAAALEMYRRQFFAARRAGLAADEATGAEDLTGLEKYRKVILGLSVARVSKAEAARFRARLQQIMDDLAEAEANQTDSDDVAVINVLVGYFSAAPATAP